MKNTNKSIIIGSTVIAISVLSYYFFKPKNSNKTVSKTVENKTENNSLPIIAKSKTDLQNNSISNAVNPQTSKQKAVFGTNNGYQIFNTGLIIQFGHSGTNVVFPIPFPNSCLSVSVSTDRGSSGSRGFNHATNVTKKGFTAVLDGKFGYWMAIGH